MSTGTISHVIGVKEPPLLEITIGEVLLGAAQRWPDELALVSRHQDVRLSWAGGFGGKGFSYERLFLF